jgi:hypothetical protein
MTRQIFLVKITLDLTASNKISGKKIWGCDDAKITIAGPAVIVFI